MNTNIKKKGLSPVIATVLLVSMAIVLAVIVFFWARTFVGDAISKNGRAIELSCEEVSFKAEAISSAGQIFIENTGNVPIYGIEVRERKVLSGEILQTETIPRGTIVAGETANVSLPSELEINDEIIIIPVLLGETNEFKKAHVCDEAYGIETEVK